MIEVNGVTKRYKSLIALNNVSLHVPEGQYLALLGPNGAGKTTLMEILEGIRVPDEGSVVIAGFSWKRDAKSIREILGISFQETHFIDKLTVIETLRLFAAFYNLPAKRIDEVLTDINLHEKKSTRTKDLSGGQKQRLALGLALLNFPRIIFLDEPTTGLDPNARREIWDVLLHLKKEKAMTMILTTHYMEEAEILCDRIVIIDKGKILADGSKQDLLLQMNRGEIIRFRTSTILQTIELPQQGLLSFTIDELGNAEIFTNEITKYLPGLLDMFGQRGIIPESLECKKLTLDDLFVYMTGRKLDE